MSTITTQNWDGVTAPSATITGWTVDSGWTTETGKHVSAANGIGTAANFSGYKFLTYNTADSNSGNVVAAADFYFDDSDQENYFGVCVRGSATPLNATSTTQYLAEVRNEDYSDSSWSVLLEKQIAGTRTSLGFLYINTSIIYGGWYRLLLTASGTSLSVAIVRQSDGYYLGTGGTFSATVANCLTATNSDISGSGYSGLYAWGTTSHGSPVYTDDFELDTASGGSTNVTVSASPETSTGVLSTATEAFDWVLTASALTGSGVLATAAAHYAWDLTTTAFSGSGVLDSATVADDWTLAASALTSTGVLDSAAADYDWVLTASALTSTGVLDSVSVIAGGSVTIFTAVFGFTGVFAASSQSGGFAEEPAYLAADGTISDGWTVLTLAGFDVTALVGAGTIPDDYIAGYVNPLAALGVLSPINLLNPPSVSLNPLPLAALGVLTTLSGLGYGLTVPTAALVGSGVLSSVSTVSAGNLALTAAPLIGAGVIATARTWLNWTGAGIVYEVYGNDGADGAIDYSDPLAVTDGLSWSPGELARPSNNLFAVRASSLISGLEEKNLDARIELILDDSGADITNRPMPPTTLRAIQRPAGAIRAEWSYARPATTAKRPTGFHVYATAGSSIDYTTPAATVAYTGSTHAVANLTGLTNGTAYSIGVRAYNATGEEPNTSAVSCLADATGPTAVVGLTSTASL